MHLLMHIGMCRCTCAKTLPFATKSPVEHLENDPNANNHSKSLRLYLKTKPLVLIVKRDQCLRPPKWRLLINKLKSLQRWNLWGRATWIVWISPIHSFLVFVAKLKNQNPRKWPPAPPALQWDGTCLMKQAPSLHAGCHPNVRCSNLQFFLGSIIRQWDGVKCHKLKRSWVLHLLLRQHLLQL